MADKRDAIAALLVERMTPRERLSPRTEPGWDALPVSENVEYRPEVGPAGAAYLRFFDTFSHPPGMLRYLQEEGERSALAEAPPDVFGLSGALDDYVRRGAPE